MNLPEIMTKNDQPSPIEVQSFVKSNESEEELVERRGEVRLFNRSNVAQKIWNDEGKRMEIAPKTVVWKPTAIAKIFLQKCAPYITVYKDTIIPAMPGEKIVYVANMTGNVFDPALTKVKAQRYNHTTKRHEITEIDNPNVQPQVIKKQLPNDEETISDSEKVTLPRRLVQIPPYSRLPVPKPVADWLVGRDAMSDIEYRGKVRICRAPSDFEPNETWDLHEIMLYGRMIDEERYKKFDAAEYHRVKSGQVKDEIDGVVGAKKDRELRRIFFMLVNNEYRLPTEKEFRAVQKRTEAEAQKKR